MQPARGLARIRARSRAAHFESSVAPICLVATIAGAMTIPIKARAIKRSCIGILLVRRPGLSSSCSTTIPRARIGFLFKKKPIPQGRTVVLRPQKGFVAVLQMNHRRDKRKLEIARKPCRVTQRCYCVMVVERGESRSKDHGNAFYVSVKRCNAQGFRPMNRSRVYRADLRFCDRHFRPSHAK